MPENVNAYKCSYCNKASLSKSSIVRHEKKFCRMNKHCSICKHLTKDSETIYNPNHGGDPGSTDFEVPVYFCEAKELPIEEGFVTNCPLFQPAPVPHVRN